MTTSASHEAAPAFAVWLTGPPASGKSTIAQALVDELHRQSVDVAVLESDALRRVLTPSPTYSETERDLFYNAMLHIGQMLVSHGVPVIFDATANRRRYRDSARQTLARFLEVHVTCPLNVCMTRDPKGLYRRAVEEGKGRLPGIQTEYEPPLTPELTIGGDTQSPQDVAKGIVAELQRRRWLPTAR